MNAEGQVGDDRARIRGHTPESKLAVNQRRSGPRRSLPRSIPARRIRIVPTKRVQLFLSQVSRYFTLATDIDMDGDIVECAGAFLDGFAYTWFDNLDKGSASKAGRKSSMCK